MYKELVLFLCAVATNAAPGYPPISCSVAGMPLFRQIGGIFDRYSIVRPALHYARLEGAPVEEHVIDSLPPQEQIYATRLVKKTIDDNPSLFESTRPHIEYSPGVRKPNSFAYTKGHWQ